MTFRIDLVGHMDAGKRARWRGDQDERPLSELGRRQAEALAEALESEPIDALYAGPALRCRQTLEPLAERRGLTVAVLPELGEKRAWRGPEGWESSAHEAAFAAGTALRAIDKLRTLHPEGSVVACSHGHVIPALVAYLVAAHEMTGVPEVTRRGQWHALRFVDGHVAVERREAQGFPTG